MTERKFLRAWAVVLMLTGLFLLAVASLVHAQAPEQWEARLFIFVRGDDSPMQMMVGTFPKRFGSEDKCEAYLNAVRPNMARTVEEYGDRVLNYKLACFDVSGEGEPI
ncbi:MAG TPA: hypothetical protein VKA19_07225 [Alphaproteobacteria bacterium]|nr:hypothetical protein [Alphaproteobacteria bacterium]